MITERTRMREIESITLGLFFVGMSLMAIPPGRAAGDYGKDLRLTIHTDRQMFQCGEAVPLTLKITSDGETTIWFGMGEPYIELTSASGELISVPMPDPNAPLPGHYYMERNGKRVYTMPVLRIEGGQTVSETIPDALKRYHRYISTGVYHLKAKVILGFYKETDVFRRPDFPDELRVETQGGLPQLELVSNLIKIEIRESEVEKPERNLFGWPYLLVGAVIVVAVVGIALILKKKAIKRESQP